MKLFIDTANIDEIKKASELGIIDGVTTNPTLISKVSKISKDTDKKSDFKDIIKKICDIIDGPISAEVISLDSETMIREAIELAQIHKNIVIKIPMCSQGLKAVKYLKTKNIKTNVTLIFSAQQALLASKAGASYVSPFLGRLDDIGQTGLILIKDIVDLFLAQNIKTEIICASIRNPIHVIDCGKLGAHIATVPYNILNQMIEHPMTSIGIDKFLKDWNN
ncbi:MAG: fructose-6-phosphate aldolase [Oscillospiraceae bacterium]|nr:fructose-6-phosphate aldolase [Oscillospiraceae bacterium]